MADFTVWASEIPMSLPIPFDNNTGQVGQTGVNNEAGGIAVTAEYVINDGLSAKLIFSDRHSEYEAGLDDDSLFENILTFP